MLHGVQRLRDLSQTDAATACALVSYDPNSSRQEMERCVGAIETSTTDSDKRKIVEMEWSGRYFW